MTCKNVWKANVMRHDLLAQAWCRIVSRAGISVMYEPPLEEAGRSAETEGQGGDRGDLQVHFMGQKARVVMADVSVSHPCSRSYVKKASKNPGAAAEERDKRKRKKYGQGNAYEFVPLSVESFGYLGSPAYAFLQEVAAHAADGTNAFSRASFVSGALAQLSVCLCRGISGMYRASLQLQGRASGRRFFQGAHVAALEDDW
jgi:hypothetical protein